MSLLKLDSIKTPTLDLELPGGEAKSYDLYELGEKLNTVKAPENEDGTIDLGAQYDAIRGVFGFPTSAEAVEKSAFTLSRAQCEYLHTEVYERISKQPEKKRFFALLRSYSGAMDSSPAK